MSTSKGRKLKSILIQKIHMKRFASLFCIYLKLPIRRSTMTLVSLVGCYLMFVFGWAHQGSASACSSALTTSVEYDQQECCRI